MASYFKSKHAYLVDGYKNTSKFTLLEYQNKKAVYELHDKHVNEKFEFMYNYKDFDNDRTKLRD